MSPETKQTSPPEQQQTEPGVAQPPATEESFFDRIWLSGQANFVRQQHGDFAAAYSGLNSLANGPEHATSRVLTLYSGFEITKNLAILADIESAGGAGLSNALGVAGFTNVDVVRNPTLGTTPYVARVMLHWVVPLSGAQEETTRSPLSIFSTLPMRRLEFRAGRMSTADFFDANTVGSDSHTQFLNWAAVNNASFDYAADTRGYTYGVYLEYDDRWGAVRFGEMLMPTVANGVALDWALARAGGTNLEVELHRNLMKQRPSIVRLLSFVNRADMGTYREAINGYLSGKDRVPDITEYRQQGRVKYGFGLNAEQYITKQWEAYGRLGWNEGANESFAYTEADRSASIGSILYGKWWHRPDDKLGEAFLVNGISGDHRRYLQLGGLGFILGDGGLTYGLEKIFETFYNADVWHGISVAFDYQHVTNPGYNEVRGPVSVFSVRVHVEGAVPFAKIANALNR